MSIKQKNIPLRGVVEFARNFSSTGAAFLLATLGVITQTFHNGFLFFELSSFENIWLNLIQTLIGAFGLSGALLYFTVRAANSSEKSTKLLVWLFFAFEVYCNIYYWANKYIITPWGTDDVLWSSMIIALPFAFMLPFAIKSYAGELSLAVLDEEDEVIENDEVKRLEKMIENKEIGVDAMDSLMERLGEETKGMRDEIGKGVVEDLKSEFIKNGDEMRLNIKTVDDNGKENIKVLNAKMQRIDEN